MNIRNNLNLVLLQEITTNLPILSWMQVAGNEDGVTAFQMDIKVTFL